MPEIWLNYGVTEVVLDIKEENLGQRIDSTGSIMQDAVINERLVDSLDLSGAIDLVVMHDSVSVRRIISMLFALCEQRSLPFPRILANKRILHRVKAGLPEGSMIIEFGGMDGITSDSKLVFIAEIEFDGLFGYETIATRLIKEFGRESMLVAYAKRDGNLPAPGKYPESMTEAKKFANSFEIQGIEIVACSQGIIDVRIGHPAETLSATKTLESGAIRDMEEERCKTMIISTGKEASNSGLGKALSSLWNCASIMKDGGLAMLVAECRYGLESEAIQQYVEGRLVPEHLHNPTRYVNGMEDLLFLSGIKKRFQIGLISVLPEFYVGKIGMIPVPGMKHTMDYILKTQGARQKVVIVSDGARTLLR